jgi:putative SOS response-associated peptidase YedK
MCGRFVVYSAGEQLRDLLGIADAPEVSPRYNLAVTDPVPVGRVAERGPRAGQRELVQLRWGLVPWWAEDAKIGHRCFNARVESAAEKPAFRDAFRQRRAVVLADGFYEWRREGPRRKQPFYFHMADGRPFAFAALWARNTRLGEPLETVSILTGPPNELLAPFHDRMGVILTPEALEAWLDPGLSDVAELRRLLVPFSAESMAAHAVDPAVNRVGHEGPRLIEPYEGEADPAPPAPPRQGSLF